MSFATPGSSARRAGGRPIPAIGGLALLALILATPNAQAQSRYKVSIRNSSSVTIKVTIGGFGVTPVTCDVPPNVTWSPTITATAKSYLITATIGTFKREKRVNFNSTQPTVLVNDKPPIRPFKIQ